MRVGRAAATIVVALVLSVVAGTTASAAVTVKASAPSTYPSGTSATIAVSVSSSYSGSAKLQVKSGSTWTTAARTIVIKSGKGSTTVEPSSVRTYRIKVGSSYSNSVTVTPVVPKLVASGAAAELTAGQSTSATLTVSPAFKGTARLQYQSGGAWVTADRVLTLSSGKVTTSLKPPSTRTYRFTAFGRYSAAFTVVVNPKLIPDSFTITGSGWGHGVGMSQYGAQGMALDGHTAAEILTHYYTGTDVEMVPADTPLRVNVFGKSPDSTTTAQLMVRSPGSGEDANGRWRMLFYATAGSTTAATTWTGTNNELLSLTRSGTTVSVTRANGDIASGAKAVLQWEATTAYQPESVEDPYVEITTASGSAATHGTYRHGVLEISASTSRLRIVNELKLNTEYLYGIAEMPSSWSSEALKAQAIAARGYAIRKPLSSATKSSCACDVWDDTSSQNFTGWKKESEGTDAYYGKRWVAAVNATNSDAGASGAVLTFGSGGVGNIAATYYFSSSGGQTENSEDVWSSTVSYLRSVPDPWSVASATNNPNDAWTITLSQASIAADFGLPDVVTVAISERTSANSTAAAMELTAMSSTGDVKTLTGTDTIRTTLGVKSPWIWTIDPN